MPGEPAYANLEYDFFLIEHQSPGLDITFMVKTTAALIRGIGAI